MASVTVVTAGKHDSTHEVGEAIASRLRSRGHEAAAVVVSQAGDLPEGAAVVLGSAIYMGRWLKPARRLAERLAAESNPRPLWLFSVGPIGDPPAPESPTAEDLVGVELAGRAQGMKVFSGRLDRDALGRLERLAVNAQDAPDGDFRDWQAIEGWADKIATELAGCSSGDS